MGYKEQSEDRKQMGNQRHSKPKILGADTAKRLLLTAEKIQATEMKEIGFLTRLVKPEELDSSVEELVQKLMLMAPLAILGMKKHINTIASNTLNVDELNQDIATAQNSEDL